MAKFHVKSGLRDRVHATSISDVVVIKVSQLRRLWFSEWGGSATLRSRYVPIIALMGGLLLLPRSGASPSTPSAPISAVFLLLPPLSTQNPAISLSNALSGRLVSGRYLSPRTHALH